MWIHNKINPHAGIETTIRDVYKKMRVSKGLRKLVKKITQDLVKCKIKMKKVSEVKMVYKHPLSCFNGGYSIWFQGKPFKGARKELKVYSLVIMCLLSGACNILAMEGCQTQDVVASIARHSARYGVPGYIYINNGTQLKALKHSSMSLRDVHTQVQDSLCIKVVFSTEKAHSERERVE